MNKFEELLIKEQFKFDKNIDFNLIANILNFLEHDSIHSGPWLNQKVLSSTFQIKSVEKYDFINAIYKFLEEKFNKKNLLTNIDLFFSFQSGSRSNLHVDNYDVRIISLLGRTLYKVEDKDYIVSPGDLLHIPKNLRHVAIALDPRIIISYGLSSERY
jgi:ribosomal protein L16 Arg81 hydroxylase